jgi:N-sulfoglucosamine sulfohydrolase
MPSARLHLLRLVVWLTLPVACATTCAATPAPSRPNLLFILTEDQGAHLGFLGTPGLQTPHLDALARRGVFFDRAFVAYPVCSASKAALYTGLHSHANGIVNNTLNLHKPAADLTPAERRPPLFLANRIRAEVPTLVERLHAAGYHQGVTHKLHVLPNEKFPYDEFLRPHDGATVAAFIARAAAAKKPWHLFLNLPHTHRAFPDSDTGRIRVDPAAVALPPFLPDTPVVRRDWSEYLAAIERADASVGEALAALRASGEEARTLVVFLGDHGPALQRGKMTPYDLGLRTPLVIHAPWLRGGVRTDALASTVDLAPTLLDLLELAPLPRTHGVSLRPVLEAAPGARPRPHAFAAISHCGPAASAGLQERAVTDGRWKLIYRERLSPAWRIVQDDSRSNPRWRNRTYAETVAQRARFPEAFRILAEFDPQTHGGTLRPLEFYDLAADPHELSDLAADPAARRELARLYGALRDWVNDTGDAEIQPAPVF